MAADWLKIIRYHEPAKPIAVACQSSKATPGMRKTLEELGCPLDMIPLYANREAAVTAIRCRSAQLLRYLHHSCEVKVNQDRQWSAALIVQMYKQKNVSMYEVPWTS